MPTRVLHVIEAFVGGAERHVYDLVTGLDPKRFTVTVACSVLRDPSASLAAQRLADQGIRVIRLPMVRPIRPGLDLACGLALYRHIRSTGYDLVHTHCAKGGFLGRFAAAWAGVTAVVHTAHGFPFLMDVSPPQRRLYLALERRTARHTSRFIAVSRSERDHAVAAGLAPANRFTVIPNGIAPTPPPVPPGSRAAFNLEPDDQVLGIVGRISKQKGQDDLVRAVARLAGRFPRLRVMVVGDGERAGSVKRLARESGVQDRFRWLGYRHDAPALYPLWDITVFASRWEGLPYALLDSMAAGRPLVATRVGGLGDVVESEAIGRLAPPHDPAALAGAIAHLLDNPAEREQLGRRAAEAVSHYPLAGMLTATSALYELLTHPGLKT